MTQRRLLVTGGSGFIGANFIREAQACDPEAAILNLDTARSKDASNEHLRQGCDVLDREALARQMQMFAPTHVLHFAARTDVLGKTVGDYLANHVGTANVIAAIQGTPSVRNAIFTSSQFVVGPGELPRDDEDFRPHTVYGQTKVLGEQAVRAADLHCAWTIIRPTNVWGRWHPRYPTEFWRVLKQGRYFHPGGRRVMRCYAYVDNVVKQTWQLMDRDDGAFDRQVFYVGDDPIDLLDWTNAFSRELTGRPVRVVPSSLLRAVGKVGDVIIAAGGRFPLFSSRFRSMTEDYMTPMAPTFAALGPSPVGLEQGVKDTVAWLRSEDPFWA